MLAVITDYNSAMIEWAKDTTGVGTPEHAADQIRIIKTASGKFNDILTKDQQAAWKEMIGNELPLEKILRETTALGGAATPKIAAPVVAPPPIVELPQPPPAPKGKQPQ